MNRAKVTCRIIKPISIENNEIVLRTQKITFMVDVDNIEMVKQISHTPDENVNTIKQWLTDHGADIPVRVEELPDLDVSSGHDV